MSITPNFSKTILVIVVVCCSSSLANAQTTLKMYGNYTYSSDYTYGSTLGITRDSFVTTETRNTNINMLPAIRLAKENGRYVEYGVANFLIKQNDDSEKITNNGNTNYIGGAKKTEVNIGARTEFGKTINAFKPESKFKLDLGFANTYSFYHLNVNPVVSNSFPYRINQGSIDVAFVPRISYTLNSNCALELSTLFGMAEVGLESTTIENPNSPIAQRTNTALNMEVLPNRYVFRFGFAYTL